MSTFISTYIVYSDNFENHYINYMHTGLSARANGIVIVARLVKKRTNIFINCVTLSHICVQIIRLTIKLVTSDIKSD